MGYKNDRFFGIFELLIAFGGDKRRIESSTPNEPFFFYFAVTV